MRHARPAVTITASHLINLTATNCHILNIILVTAENVGISTYHWWQTTLPELARTCKACQRRYVLHMRVMRSYQVMIIGISSLHMNYITWLVDNMITPQSWWACISPSPVAITDMLVSIFPTQTILKDSECCWEKTLVLTTWNISLAGEKEK